MVSNELLHKAFSIFGEIERCVVGIDARGRSTNEAIVEFEKKPCALECVKRCTEGCFFLTTSLRPVIAEIQEEAEDDGGLQEAMLPKRNQEYHGEREVCISHNQFPGFFRSFSVSGHFSRQKIVHCVFFREIATFISRLTSFHEFFLHYY